MSLSRVLMLAVVFGCSVATAEEKTPSSTEPAVDEKKEAGDVKSDSKPKVRRLGILLYDRFEALDVFGPVEVFGNVGKQLEVVMVAEKAGPVRSTQGPQAVAEFGFEDCPQLDILLVPGGIGTLKQLRDQKVLDWLRQRSESAELVLSVCSGSAILAKAGLLDGKQATSNKQSFRLLTSQGKKVDWVKEARWVEDGKYFTSSGVSAGIDMSLAVVAKLYSPDLAQKIADATEYEWHRDSTWDPFTRFVK